MRKLINRKYVDPSIPGIAYQLATWERYAQPLAKREASLHAEIMMRVPLVKRQGGVFNG